MTEATRTRTQVGIVGAGTCCSPETPHIPCRSGAKGLNLALAEAYTGWPAGVP